MGNVLSEEEVEEQFLEEGFNLESPDADKQINFARRRQFGKIQKMMMT